MQIIIPMSGFGERFRKAGYDLPKPLIEMEGKPIIGHVIDMFPGETDFIFICNQDHLDEPKYNMESILKKLCPSGRVVGIASHKLGPVHAVLQVEDLISNEGQTIVNYCDFTCYWDWDHFKEFVNENECIGSIPSYKGFHPHTLGSTNYAYMKQQNGWVEDIQEKKPYTENRMEEFASSGTYYFSSGSIMKQAFHSQVQQNLNLAGEFYVSLAYKPLLKEKKKISVYPLQHFMQWGTPEDVSEYNYWSKAFKKLTASSVSKTSSKGSFIIPMAGLGKRFADRGYKQIKPLIPVSGHSMVLQAANDLPDTVAQVFVLRSDMKGFSEVSKELRKYYPDCIIKTIDSVTDGQAITAAIGLEALNELDQAPNPITFAACDNGALYEVEKFNSLVEDIQTDILVWCVRGYENAVRKPEMYGWIDTDSDGLIKQISVKTPLDNPSIDPIVIGSFTFKKSEHFYKSLDRLLKRNGLINGEFYIDSLINDAIDLGLRCKIFEVDSFLCWGTPDDLNTFEYWQSCFHKWPSHPYRLELDARVSKEALPILNRKYKAGQVFNSEVYD